MNRYPEDRGQHSGEFHTHRSERYRHPEKDSGYRFDDYGSSARGGYGNEGNLGTWGNQGNEMAGSRNYARDYYGNDRGSSNDRYGESRNYGNMGSYGGAQGFGDIRGGRHDQGHPFDSGMGESRRYSGQSNNPSGYREDREEHRNYGRSRGWDNDREDLYGHEVSRRFQGSSGQDHYDFERDDYYSSNYGDDQGNYMGSGYNRTSQSRYGSGDYGSSGFMDQGRDSGQNRRRSHEFNTASNRRNSDW